MEEDIVSTGSTAENSGSTAENSGSTAGRSRVGAGRLVVLAGGLSHERDVSLRSGRRVAEALRGTGVEVEERDVDAALLPALAADRPACVIPMLHGEAGEDGAIREVLELVDVPYVGSRPLPAGPPSTSPSPRRWSVGSDCVLPSRYCLPLRRSASSAHPP